MPKENSPLWRTYEEQVAELVAALDSNAEVIQNKRVEARLSKAMRQVDVWVRGKIIGQEDCQAELAKLLADPRSGAHSMTGGMT